MMTAIHERKREIGILQAIGGKRGAIFTIFLLESFLYGLFGGILGVLAGLAFSYLGSPYISQNEFTAFLKGTEVVDTFTVRLVLGAIVFSVIISLVSGIYPAYRASRLTPVEAISYE
jgi:putative ABC transport system permease protein